MFYVSSKPINVALEEASAPVLLSILLYSQPIQNKALLLCPGEEVGYAMEDDGNLLTEEEQETNSRRNHRSRIGNENQNMEPRMLNRPLVETRAGFNQVQVAEQLIPAKDIIRTIKAVNGQDDIGYGRFH